MNAPVVSPIARGTALLLLVAAPLLFVAPILWTGHMPRGADHVFHLQLARGFVDGMQSGVYYPRWLEGANLGYGSPAPINYPPFGAYLVALPQLLGVSAFNAWVLAITLSACGAAWAFYACARDLVTPLPAAVGAALYTLAPYHALNLYDRFAFAELNAFIWLPLVFKYQRRLHQQPDVVAWLLFALSFGLLVVTHIVTAYLAVFFVALFGLALPSSIKRWRVLSLTAAAGFVGCALAAIYLLPVVLESAATTHPDYFLKVKWGAWMRNFVFRDETQFGFTRAKIGDAVDHTVAASGVLMLLAMLVLIRGASTNDTDRSRPAGLTRQSWALVIVACAAAFMQLPVSTWVWRTMPKLELVSFPWRFQTFHTFFVALVFTTALSTIGARWIKAVMWLGVVVSMWLAASFVTRVPLKVDDKAMESRGVIAFVQAEHIPRGVRPWPQFPGKEKRPLRGRQVQATARSRTHVEQWKPQHRSIVVEGRAPTSLILHTFYFPGWRATVDGQRAKVHAEGPFRLLRIDVPAGKHEVDVRFGDTAARRAGLITSAVTALLMLIVFGSRRWIGRRLA